MNGALLNKHFIVWLIISIPVLILEASDHQSYCCLMTLITQHINIRIEPPFSRGRCQKHL